MNLHILFGQRKQRYDGEYAPEALVCWTEHDIDENPAGFEDACEEARKEYGPEFSAIRVIIVAVDNYKIDRLLNKAPTVEGEISEKP
jgi:hypothetical protein